MLSHLLPDNRIRAYAGISALGAAVDLTDLTGGRDLVLLFPYDPATRRVLRGPQRGQSVAAVAALGRAALRHGFATVPVTEAVCRPWWRGFRPTPALRLVAHGRADP